MFVKMREYAKQNSGGNQMVILAGAFFTIMYIPAIFNNNSGIFRQIGATLSHIPSVWIAVTLLCFLSAILFVRRLIQKRSIGIFTLTFLFAATLVSVGILKHVSPPPVVFLVAHMIFDFIIVPLYTLYAGIFLFFLGNSKGKFAESASYYLLGIGFFWLGYSFCISVLKGWGILF